MPPCGYCRRIPSAGSARGAHQLQLKLQEPTQGILFADADIIVLDHCACQNRRALSGAFVEVQHKKDFGSIVMGHWELPLAAMIGLVSLPVAAIDFWLPVSAR